jgi:hypothetical protein
MSPDAAEADAAPTDGRRHQAPVRGSVRHKDAEQDPDRGRARAATRRGRTPPDRAGISDAASGPRRPVGRLCGRGGHPAMTPTRQSWMRMTHSRTGTRTPPAGRSVAGTSPVLPAAHRLGGRAAEYVRPRGREAAPAPRTAGRDRVPEALHSVRTARPRPVERATAGPHRTVRGGAAPGCILSPGYRATRSERRTLPALLACQP